MWIVPYYTETWLSFAILPISTWTILMMIILTECVCRELLLHIGKFRMALHRNKSTVREQCFPVSSVPLISAERCRKAVPLWTRFDLTECRTIHHFDCPVLGMYLAGSGSPLVSPRSPCTCETRANLDTTKTFRSR